MLCSNLPKSDTFLRPSIIFKYKDENLWRQSDICLNDGTYNLLVLMLVVVLVMLVVMVMVVSLASQAPNFPRFRCLSRWSSAEASIPNLTWLKSQIGFVAMDGFQNNEKRIQQQCNQPDKEREEKNLDHWMGLDPALVLAWSKRGFGLNFGGSWCWSRPWSWSQCGWAFMLVLVLVSILFDLADLSPSFFLNFWREYGIWA